MKTAILLVGKVRTWDRCKPNFMAAFGSLNADVFVSTYGTQYAYHPWIQKTTNFNQERVLTQEQVVEKLGGLNVRSCVVDGIESYVDSRVKPFICDKFPRDAHLSLSQYFKLNDCISAMNLHEKENGNYDVVIKTRFDITYASTIESMLPTMDLRSTVYVDAHGAGVYPCDWIVMGNRTNMMNTNKFVMNEIRDMKNESSLQDMPHKLFLNGVLSTGKIECRHLVSVIARGA